MVRKTPEHLEAEKNLRGKEDEGLKVAKRELSKQRRKYKGGRILQETLKAKCMQNTCNSLFCVKEGNQRVTGKNAKRSWNGMRGTRIRMMK